MQDQKLKSARGFRGCIPQPSCESHSGPSAAKKAAASRRKIPSIAKELQNESYLLGENEAVEQEQMHCQDVLGTTFCDYLDFIHAHKPALVPIR
jgi:hypothetical protein